MFWAGFAAGVGFALIVLIGGSAWLVLNQMRQQQRLTNTIADETRRMIAERLERAAREAAARRG